MPPRREPSSARWHCYDFFKSTGQRDRAVFWLRWYRSERRRLAFERGRYRFDDFGELMRRPGRDAVQSIFDVQ